MHLDGYNNLDYWTGKPDKSARREFFYYDETDLMAIRVDAWKMMIGVKHNGDWFDEKSYPSVPYIVNLLMDPLEKVTPDAPGYEYAGRKFVAQKPWAPTAAGAVPRRTKRRARPNGYVRPWGVRLRGDGATRVCGLRRR